MSEQFKNAICFDGFDEIAAKVLSTINFYFTVLSHFATITKRKEITIQLANARTTVAKCRERKIREETRILSVHDLFVWN